MLWAIGLEQEPSFIVKQSKLGSTARITCHVTGGSSSTLIHWYQALPGQALQRILYLSLSGDNLEQDIGSKDKFSAYGKQQACNFIVRNLKKTDSGDYYCAIWDLPQSHNPLPALPKKPSTVLGVGLNSYLIAAARQVEPHTLAPCSSL